MRVESNDKAIANVQTNSPPPAHLRAKALDSADVDMDILRSFARRHGMQLSLVIERFLKIEPDFLDEDKSIVLQREQAKLSTEIMKAVSPKELQHSGSIDHKVSVIERRIIDA